MSLLWISFVLAESGYDSGEPADCGDSGVTQVYGGEMVDSACVADLDRFCTDCGTWEESLEVHDGLLVDCAGSGQHLAWRVPYLLGSAYQIWIYDGDEVAGIEVRDEPACCDGHRVNAVYYGGKARLPCLVPMVADAPYPWPRDPECTVSLEDIGETSGGGCASTEGGAAGRLAWIALLFAGLAGWRVS